MNKSPNLIGVFDSGVGGLSILRALHARLPFASMVYVGDVAWAPYGDRPGSEVVSRCMTIVEWLVLQGAATVVIACNTATALAIEALRERWPAMRFIGVEPGVKPAALRSKSRRIAVMATAATARSARLRKLITQHAPDSQVDVHACIGLASAIEKGILDGPELMQMLRPICLQISDAGVDTVVLGCTHYPFVASTIRALLGDRVELLDTAIAVAERTASFWKAGTAEAGGVRVLSTGQTVTMQRLLARCPGLDRAQVHCLSI